MKKTIFLSLILITGLLVTSLNPEKTGEEEKPKIYVQMGHTGRITCVDISKNDKYFVSGGEDNLVILWDFNKGKELRRFNEHEEKLKKVKFSNDGNFILSSGEYTEICIWDIKKNILKNKIKFDIYGNTWIVDINFTNDSLFYYFIGYEYFSIIKKMNDTVFKNIKKHLNSDEINLLNSSYVQDMEGIYNIIDNLNITKIKSIDDIFKKIQNNFNIYNCTNYSDRSIIYRYFMRLYDLDNNPVKNIFLDDFNTISKNKNNVQYAGCRDKILFFRINNNFELYNIEMEKTDKKINIDKNINSFWISDDFNFICYDIIDKNNIKELILKDVNKNDIYSLDLKKNINGIIYESFFSANNRYLVCLFSGENSADNKLLIYELSTKSLVNEIEASYSGFSAFAITNNEKYILSVPFYDKFISCWDIDKSKLIKTYTGNSLWTITSLSHSNKIRFVSTTLSGINDYNSLKIIDLNSNYKIVNSISFDRLGSNGISKTGEVILFNCSVQGNNYLVIENIQNLFNKKDYNAFNGYYLLKFFKKENKFLCMKDKNIFLCKLNENENNFNIINSFTLPEIAGSNDRKEGLIEDVDLISTSDGEKIIIYCMNKNIFIYSLNEGIITKRFKFEEIKINRTSVLSMWNYDSIKYIEQKNKMIFTLGGKLFTCNINDINNEETIFFYDDGSISNNKIERLKFHNDFVRSIDISQDNKYLLSGSNDYTMKLWDIDTHKVINSFIHNARVSFVSYTEDGKYAISGCEDGVIRIWDLLNGELFLTFITDGIDWLMCTFDGYFDSSKNGSKLSYMIKGLEIYGLDQFAVKNNRPDIILKRLGSVDSGLIDHYYNQYLKRLRKLKLTEDKLNDDYHVPETKILDTKQNEKFIDIKFNLSDDKYSLTRYNVYVNDVPLFGAYGNEITGNNKVLTELIELTGGENKIEISCMNEIGTESFRALTYATFNPPSYKGDLYYIGFGVSDYLNNVPPSIKKEDFEEGILKNQKIIDKYKKFIEDSYKKEGKVYKLKSGIKSDNYFDLINCMDEYTKIPIIRDLTYAHKDCLDLAEILKKEKDKFNNIYTFTFTNENCNVEKIKKAKELLKNSKPDDTVVLFISGHGMHDNDKEATYYFLTHEANLTDLPDTAANFEIIEDILQNIQPRNKLFLMDTCESGEIEDQMVINTDELLSQNKGIKAKAISNKDINSTLKGDLKKIKKRTYLYDKDRYIYNDLARRSGAIVFSACRGNEFSFEDANEENGFFTKEIIKSLTTNEADKNKDGIITTDELREYVIKAVSIKSKGLQNPTVDRDNIYQKFGFVLVK